MNEKDLMRGMNHIDDDLIEEAGKAPRKGFHLSNALAAGMALVVGVGAVTGGGTIISQQKQLAALQSKVAELEAGGMAGNVAPESPAAAAEEYSENASGTVGIAGDVNMGSKYHAAQNYGEVFELFSLRRSETMPSAAEDYGMAWNSAGIKGEAIVEEAAAEADEVEAPAAAEPAPGGGGYSTTNVMTAGVDESDIVKTDGSYIYMVQSGSVQIADIRKGGVPADKRNLTVPFRSPSDSIEEMYVSDGYLTIITNHAEKKDSTMAAKSWYGWRNNYDTDVWVYVYDVADPMKPELVDSMHQDGAYKTSRKVGDIMYLFTTQQMICPDGEKEDVCSQERLQEWIPSINNVPVASDCIYLPESGYQELVISSFSVVDPATILDAKVVVDDYSEIYVSNSSIYFYQADYNGYKPITEITRMIYQDGQMIPGKSNTVIGSVQDSFAINEKDGYLRVLTTDWSGSTEVNTLMVLDPDMQQVGRLDEIARGESIYAARFLGDMAYFITYHNSDPLFVADLSDPSNPKLLGQVEISGFSDYLHVWDATHILGIGYETDEDSNRHGMKLVMFDVSDPGHPVIENAMVLQGESEWCYSNSVDSNYKAILADPVKNLIGFGYYYELVERSSNGYDRWKDYQVYNLLSYDKKNGFCMEVDTDMKLSDVSGYRGLYSGDWFYIAGNADIRTFDMKNGFAEVEE